MARQMELTPEALARLREQLLAEREELLGQTVVLDATAVVGLWRDSGYDDDYADTGSATFERERAQSLALNARRILVQIDDALRRMDAGTYGLCERCGQAIEVERLEALPYATLCLGDKQLEERTV
ncbi:MAG: TraR/DksA C4-type zinc finger protein [Actinomycetota bacterium]|nr:TraR/DksA C4-type zinc finger protein [Actinomycetota bacterium]